MKFHKDALEIPSDPKLRKQMVNDLINHSMWTKNTLLKDFFSLTDFMYVYVDPNTETIEDDESRNTAFRIWVEAGPTWDISAEFPSKTFDEYNRWGGTHDVRLDCGAPDMETLLCKLYIRVKFFYNDDGTDREEAPEECDGTLIEGTSYNDYTWQSGCTYFPHEDGNSYCSKCGFACTD